MFKNELISRDSKGRVRVVYMQGEYYKEDDEFTITRSSGQYGYKITQQPSVVISVGKAKRTVLQQGELEYKSKLKKYMDKGYREAKQLLGVQLSLATPELIQEKLPLEVTDQNGFLKPMLAKKYESVANSTLNKNYFASKKLDGLRCMIKLVDGEIKTASRGGGDYTLSMQHIVNDSRLIDFFNENPDIVLDGELYIHGRDLHYIQGLCTRQYYTEESKQIKYYIYDIVDTEEAFEERVIRLEDFADEWNSDDGVFTFVEHVPVSGAVNMENLSKTWINEGYEGAVMRGVKDKYKPNGRTMIKVKNYIDGEFKIIGYKEGLRPTQDMTFTMQTKGGSVFNATPMGSIEVKQSYIDNIQDIIGLYGTVKYFSVTKDGLPFQPTFKSIRLKSDM